MARAVLSRAGKAQTLRQAQHVPSRTLRGNALSTHTACHGGLGTPFAYSDFAPQNLPLKKKGEGGRRGGAQAGPAPPPPTLSEPALSRHSVGGGGSVPGRPPPKLAQGAGQPPSRTILTICTARPPTIATERRQPHKVTTSYPNSRSGMLFKCVEHVLLSSTPNTKLPNKAK